MAGQPPPPNKWTSWLSQIYGSGKGPVLGTVDMQEIEDKACEVMKDNSTAYLYTSRSAGTSSTDDANRKAFDRWKLVPRMLKDVTLRNTTILGMRVSSPIFIAPVGKQGLVHVDGELATARAAAAVGVPMILSSSSSRSLEDVAEANGPNGQRWYQFYWPRSSDVALSILKRAKENGYTALVITVDTMIIGWRSHDHRIGYSPAGHGFGVQQGMADPVFMKRHGLVARHERPKFPFNQEDIRRRAAGGDEEVKQSMFLASQWLSETGSGLFRTWNDLQFVKDNWDGPILLKGIQAGQRALTQSRCNISLTKSDQDAEKAIDMGIDGIIVSNHGGRQIDGAIASLDALDMIMRSQKVLGAQKSGKLTVLFDSGIRTGSDVIKALAMGAQGVLIARPIVYGLAIAGQAGVEQILMQTICDLHITMGLCGFSDVNNLALPTDLGCCIRQRYSSTIYIGPRLYYAAPLLYSHVRSSTITNEQGQVLYKIITPFRPFFMKGTSTIWKIIPNTPPLYSKKRADESDIELEPDGEEPDDLTPLAEDIHAIQSYGDEEEEEEEIILDMQDHFAQLAQIEFHRFHTSRFQWLGLNKLGLGEVSTKEFMPPRGIHEDRVPSLDLMTAHILYLESEPNNPVAQYHRYRFGILSGKRPRCGFLDINLPMPNQVHNSDENTDTENCTDHELENTSDRDMISPELLDTIIVTFIYVEKLRRERERAGKKDLRWNY
ncbi:FMN-dependent dehydrogenase-domain-containing protein [Suillus ampliporus]|nr:FMN-dependent dehydrogenase-domain-containing protein [Suillus ampliporus]